MTRIVGVDIPDNKKIEVALTYLYGIGRTNVVAILEKAGIEGTKKTKDLSGEEISRIQKVLDSVKVEGDLRKEIVQNITRLKEIGSYRGTRHAKGLPVRGQRTKTNARTKRGKKVTIGAMKKDLLAKAEASKAEKAKKQDAAATKAKK